MTGLHRQTASDYDPSIRRVVVAPLDETGLAAATAALVRREPVFAHLSERNGVPPLWSREPGFATMLRLILEQQVSLASADAAYWKLEDSIGGVEPEPFLDLGDDHLKAIGFSRQKAGYARGLASGLIDGSVDLDALAGLSDEDAIERLVAIRGVGPWTAACYLLFALLRSDVWPPGDRALEVSIGRVFGLPDAPDSQAANDQALAWQPFRSVAARLLWHEYLGGRQ